MLPYAPDLIVIDVSFISVAKVLGAVLGCMAGDFDCLAMVKPQFEVGRAGVGKGRRRARRRPRAARRWSTSGAAALGLGAAFTGYVCSGLPGPKGNRETFVWLAEPRARGRGARTSRGRRGAQVEP